MSTTVIKHIIIIIIVIIIITVTHVPRSLDAAFSPTFSYLTSSTKEYGRCQAKPPRVVFQCHALDVGVHRHYDRLVLIQHQHSVPSEYTIQYNTSI